jgi:RimJ/RimL family protein N-acetyltransferase
MTRSGHRGIAALNRSIILRQPKNITAEQCEDFERLVRIGFRTARTNLNTRIRAAKCLAFHYSPSGELTAIAALKAPDDQYRHDVFKMADSPASYTDFKVELGWVYVVPAYRRKQVATELCTQLLSSATGDFVFATTRSDNAVMSRILRACAFSEVGKPYMHRGEQLRLYLRRH